HRLKHLYPDGQIYLDLRQYDGSTLTTLDLCLTLILQLGIPQHALPSTHAPRVALLRSLLADKKSILVIDNVTDEAQIRDLLPSGSHCGIILTSRRPLAALEDAKGVHLSIWQ